MKPAQILRRLEKARQIIEVLPPDAEILTVLVDGVDRPNGCGKFDHIHLYTPFERLVQENVIDPDGWETIDEPGREFLEDSILTGGFRLFSLRQREKAAPGVTSTGSGEAAQSTTNDTPIITGEREESQDGG